MTDSDDKVAASLGRITLYDPWEDGTPILLNGRVGPSRPGLMVVLALMAGFLAYMILGSLAVFVLLLARGVSVEMLMGDMAGLLEQNAATILNGNAVGLVLGLGMLAVLMARLHTSRPFAFVRFRAPDVRALLLGLAGWCTVLPAVMWLAHLNEQLIPLPEWLRAMEEDQFALLAEILSNNGNLFLSLVVIAVVPAVCEEVFFRGYVQRNLERIFTATGAIILTGLIFGIFHLRLSQVLPLALLGIYMAYLAWRTGSLWVPVAVHFVNNAVMIIMVTVISREQRIEDVMGPETFPWYIVVISLAGFGACMYVLHQVVTCKRFERPAAT